MTSHDHQATRFSFIAQRIIPVLLGLFLLFGLKFSGLELLLANNSLDLLFRLRGPLQPEQSIIIIGVDKQSLEEFGSWPFPRREHAKLLKNLAKASAVGFDFLFIEPTEDDPKFAAAIRLGPPVVFATANNYHYNQIKSAAIFSDLVASGCIETELSGDGIIRRVALDTLQGVQPFSLALAKSSGLQFANIAGNSSSIINYYGSEESFLYLSFRDVVSGDYSQDFFQDRIVLVGAQALGLGDSHVTSFTRLRRTPGVEIQATIIGNLLQNTFIRPLSWLYWVCITATILVAIFIWPNSGERKNSLVALSATSLLLLLALFLFHQCLFLNLLSILFFFYSTYLFHLLSQLLWTARSLFIQVTVLDQELSTGLEKIYTHIPQQLIHTPLAKKGLVTAGIQQHISHLQSGVKALSLQHHFLQNLLTRELPPLILWEQPSGEVVFSNASFQNFWKQSLQQANESPDILHFSTVLQQNRAGKHPVLKNTDEAFAHFDALEKKDIQLIFDQDKFYYQLVLHSLTEPENSFHGVLAIFVDVTEIKEIERIKGEIVSIVSHELKLPLTTILGYGEMLEDRLSGGDREYAREICSQSNRLKKLIEDFLDIARLENSGQDVRKLPFSPVALAQDVVSSIFMAADQKNITITTDFPIKTSPLVGDETLLRQALINLLDNAIKFSDHQTTVTFSLTESPQHLTFAIADNGPGIAKELQTDIFEKFHRGAMRDSISGFGLGLNFVQQVIRAHQGRIFLESTPEQGATFKVRLRKTGEL